MTDVVLIGLGGIGRTVAEAILQGTFPLQLVAAVDSHASLRGRPMRDILGPAASETPVAADLSQLRPMFVGAPRPAVAIVTTASRLPGVSETLVQCAQMGLHAVSSCEELVFPQRRHPALAGRLNDVAKQHNVSILGTGINPGFAMDALALCMTSVCSDVQQVHCIRSLDAGQRREQLQKKIGAGLPPAEMVAAIDRQQLGHVGLAESVALLGAGLGWNLENVEETFDPVFAQTDYAGPTSIAAGHALGMHMTARGVCGARKVIELELTMAFGAETFDAVFITGSPPVSLRVDGGLPGDASTVNLLANAACAMSSLPPGLRTMLDLFPLRCRSGSK